MKAIAVETYGGPEVLHPVELPDPHPGTEQVRVRVDAAAIVDEIGNGIDPALAVEPGDEVVGFVDNLGAHGGYSDYVVLSAASVIAIPDGATAPEAASFLNNSLTAFNALDALELPAGATLVVTGAAGSVGGYLTHLIHRGPDVADEILAAFPAGVDAVAGGVRGRIMLEFPVQQSTASTSTRSPSS